MKFSIVTHFLSWKRHIGTRFGIEENFLSRKGCSIRTLMLEIIFSDGKDIHKIWYWRPFSKMGRHIALLH